MPLTMATAHPTTAVFHFPSARKPPALPFPLSTQFPQKLTKFQNYPQTKIFNALPKPQTPELNPPADSPPGLLPTVEEVKVSVAIEKQPETQSQSQSQFKGLNEVEQVVEKEEEEVVLMERKQRSRFDIYRYLNEKIEEAEERELAYWQSVGSPPQTGSEFGGNNKFSTTTIVQVGLSLVGAIVLDLVWSLSMAKKLNATTKEKDGRENTTIWERWAERKRMRNEVKNEGSVAIDESIVDKNIVENRELAEKGKEEESLVSKGNVVKNEGDVAIDESTLDKKIVESRELVKEAKEEENLGPKGNDSNEDDHVLESEIKKEG